MTVPATEEPATFSNLLGHGARTVQIRDLRRVEVGRMLLARTPVRVMAERLGVSTNTVNHDIRVIERHWRDSAVTDRQKLVRREAKILDELERAWLERALDDPTALDGMLRIQAQRAKLLGLNAPTSSTIEVTHSIDEKRALALEMVREQLARRRELRERAAQTGVIDVDDE